MTDKSKKTPKNKGKKEELTDEELGDVAGGLSYSPVEKNAKLALSKTIFGGDIGGENFDTLFAGAADFNTAGLSNPIRGTDQLKR